MRRVAGVWRQYNDEGDMQVLEFGNGRMVTELVGVDSPSWAFCASITGWLHEAALAAGLSQSAVSHTECRTSGGSRCVWVIRKASLESMRPGRLA
jgi:hypothetical protein